MEKIKVLELFCGIGGLHWALKETEIPFEIVGALEINPTVLETYALNFPDVRILRRNIESLTAEEIDEMGVDVVLMSPPCQPFCRTGNQQGLLDKRSSPLNQVLAVLPKTNIKYIFVENVKGFETSDARTLLTETLTKMNFTWQEFLLNPLQFGVPNSRLRYYLIGKREELKWSFSINMDNFLTEIPNEAWKGNGLIHNVIRKHQRRWEGYRRKRHMANVKENDGQEGDQESCTVVSSDKPPEPPSFTQYKIGDILEKNDDPAGFFLKEGKLTKYWNALDIVNPSSEQSCCFTKAYYHYLTGSGSILHCEESKTEKGHNKLSPQSGKFRYFTPTEVKSLMCYPENFKFPPHHSSKQCFKALGNSVNVFVVSVMFALLFS